MTRTVRQAQQFTESHTYDGEASYRVSTALRQGGGSITYEQLEQARESAWEVARSHVEKEWAKAIEDARTSRYVDIFGTPHELFSLFIGRRIQSRADFSSPARLVTNQCEGNADVAFIRDGVRYELATYQDNPMQLTLRISVGDQGFEDV